MGVTKDLIVTIEARKDNTGPIDCTFDIVSKHDIYKVKILFLRPLYFLQDTNCW